MEKLLKNWNEYNSSHETKVFPVIGCEIIKPDWQEFYLKQMRCDEISVSLWSLLGRVSAK